MNLFGISSVEMLVLVVVIVLTMGPKGLSQAMRGLRKVTDFLKSWSRGLREEARRQELSMPDLGDLDLRQYDPRQIVREAVQEEMAAWFDQGPPARSQSGPTNGRAARSRAHPATRPAARPPERAVQTDDPPDQSSSGGVVTTPDQPTAAVAPPTTRPITAGEPADTTGEAS